MPASSRVHVRRAVAPFLAASCLTALGGGLLAPPAAAAGPHTRPAVVTAPAVGSGPAAGESSVTLDLRRSAAELAAVRRLAAAPGQRDRSAAAVVDDPARRLAVVTWARAAGFRVGYASGSTVVVDGPATALATAFGTRLEDVTFRGGRYRVAAAPLVVPTTLAGVVARASGLDDRPVFGTSARFGPADVRSMENTPNRLSAPLDGGRGVTVGIVALHPWTRGDVTTWAADPLGDGSHSEAIPLAPGQITEVPVDTATTVDPRTTPGAEEVALDSEAVLATAPAARQRIYFGGNGLTSYVAVVDQMTRDAQAGLLQVATTSWGACEPFIRPQTVVALAEAIDRLIATGVTFFAASGDSDGFACSSRSAVDNTPNVNVPSDAPNVTAVGGVGTSSPRGTAPAGWAYSAWGAPFDSAKANATPPQYMGDGADGGFSYVFSAPAWQNRYFQRTDTATTDYSRAVPDIAGLADPATGLISYATFSSGGSRYFSAGGTSLSAPLSAGALADVVATTGNPTFGMGNIDPILWSHPLTLRDVTTGANAVGSATVGWDPPTGLGVPDWGALAPLLTASSDLSLSLPRRTARAMLPLSVSGPTASFTDFAVVDSHDSTVGGCAARGSTTAPTSYTLPQPGTYTLVLLARDDRGRCRSFGSAPVLYDPTPPTGRVGVDVGGAAESPTAVRFGWSFDGEDPDHFSLTLRDLTSRTTPIDHRSEGTQRSDFTGFTPGHAYQVQVDDLTISGATASASVVYLVPVSLAQTTRRGFRLVRLGGTAGGVAAVGSRRGSTLSYRFAGSSVRLGFLQTRHSGVATVLVDGRPVRTLDLFNRVGTVNVAFRTTGTHTITVLAEGRRRHKGAGTDVVVTALIPHV